MSETLSLDAAVRHVHETRHPKTVICPAHDDQNGSLSLWKQGDAVLMKCKVCCTLEQVYEAAGWTTLYDYPNEHGELLYQTYRVDLPTGEKKIRQRRPDGKGGWIWDLQDVRRVLYNLPAVLHADTVHIAEGEKCANALIKLGLTATTNAGGSNAKWLPAYTDALKGKHIIVHEDNDEPGRKHAEKVCHTLRGKVASLKLLTYPNLKVHGDVYDWLQEHSATELQARIAQTPEWEPTETNNEEVTANPFLRGLVRASEISKAEPPPRIWFAFYKSAVIMLIGQTGAGKSSLLYNFAVHAAQNLTLWNRDFELGRPLKILYLDPENAGNLCATRLERIEKGTPVELVFHDGQGVDLSNKDHIDALQSVIEQEGFDVVIIDPIATLFNTEDENNNAEAAKQMKALTALSRNTKACIIAVHHVGKNDSDIYGRGATARLAAADVGMVFRHNGDKSDGQTS